MTMRTRTRRGALGLLALVSACALGLGRGSEAREPKVPALKVEKYVLGNGLEVILHEDHTTPVVGVNLWYKVGSKDEKHGRTGFAHAAMLATGPTRHTGTWPERLVRCAKGM